MIRTIAILNGGCLVHYRASFWLACLRNICALWGKRDQRLEARWWLQVARWQHRTFGWKVYVTPAHNPFRGWKAVLP